MIITNCEQQSEAWYSVRCGKVTGTRFQALMMGLKTKGFNDLISDVMAELITEEIEPTYINEIMQRGIDLEPEAIKEYEHLSECEVKSVGFCEPNADHEFYDWIGCSPDGIIENIDPLNYGLVEVKCPLAKTHLGYISDGILPPKYINQVQGQLFVTGLAWCDFMSYYPKMKTFIIRVYPDKALHEQFTERLRFFINTVKEKLEIYENYGKH